jgi:hypothetical protein
MACGKRFKTKRIKAPKGYRVLDAVEVSSKIAGVTFERIKKMKPSRAPKYRRK